MQNIKVHQDKGKLSPDIIKTIRERTYVLLDEHIGNGNWGKKLFNTDESEFIAFENELEYVKTQLRILGHFDTLSNVTINIPRHVAALYNNTGLPHLAGSMSFRVTCSWRVQLAEVYFHIFETIHSYIRAKKAERTAISAVNKMVQENWDELWKSDFGR